MSPVATFPTKCPECARKIRLPIDRANKKEYRRKCRGCATVLWFKVAPRSILDGEGLELTVDISWLDKAVPPAALT